MKKMLFIVGIILAIACGYCLTAWLIKLLWNFIAIYFAIKVINFPIALALAITMVISIIASFFKSSK
ncbi:hypothetical protein FDC62_07850 [Clostridium botulinum]|uniref:hypothetical protein n=1 Tax=Clostridium botulinum TaxID=1491 RepID=UPI0009926A06|nr:hypothetical protein [Clostridium botulinum]NFO98122.1 hypothetical protein [Clostridium botulinum]OOV53117.1 hypothetical protein B1A66_00840 [Clostridium botulinum D/C]OOV58315.1 hypothetical protein B0673_02430 [Clostridium botulinum D/C]OOV59622.1 hypothetical protein B1A67_00885 [Clostridium botulinum D/C]